MKKIILILTILFCLNNYAQTYITIPSGYVEGAPVLADNNYVYFTARKGTSVVNYSTDYYDVFRIHKNTNALTQLTYFNNVGTFPTPPSNFQIYNGDIYFSDRNTLYRISGVSGAVSEIYTSPIIGSGTYVDHVFCGINKVFFRFGREQSKLYVYDTLTNVTIELTVQGLVSLVNANQFIEFDNKVYFVATRADSSNATYIHFTDGTSANTGSNIPLVGSSYLFGRQHNGSKDVERAINCNGNLIFYATAEGSSGASYVSLSIEPYRAYYTLLGRGDGNPKLFYLNGLAYLSNGSTFSSTNGVTTSVNTGLSSSNFRGTSAANSYSASTRDYLVYNNKVYGSLEIEANIGRELYSSDGTAAGTQIVKDINIGSGSISPLGAIIHNNKMYFTANNGSAQYLYQSDGTEVGTKLIFETVNSIQSIIGLDNYLYVYGINGVNKGLYKLDLSTLIITPPPTAEPQSFCNSATVANLVATGQNLKWFNGATGGTALANNTALTTGTYYISQTVGGVESARTAVSVTFNNTPAPIASAQTLNSAATVSNLVATGINLQWYTVATAGTSLSTSTPLATGIYYVSQTINGCESSRTSAAVTISNLPIVATPVTYCKGAIATALSAGGAVGSTLKWYTAATGGTGSLIAPTPSTTTVGSRNYYVSQTVSGVESARVLLAVVVNALPATPGTIIGTAAQGSLVGTTTLATYSITPVAGATSYEWTAPAGVNIIGATDGTSVTVNFLNVSNGAGAIGNLSVKAVNSNGCSSAVKNLALTKALPVAPTGIKMYDDAFPTFSTSTGAQVAITSFAKYMGTTRVLRLTATPSLTATSYVWELPVGVNQVSGGTSNEITVNFLGVTSGNTFNYTTASGVSINVVRIGVKSSNGVGVSITNTASLINPITSSSARQLTLTAVRPAAVAAVTGQIAGLCGGSSYTYSIRDTALASSYTVTAPAGAVVNFTSTLTFTVTYPIGFVVNTSTTLPNKTLVITSVNGVGTSVTSRTLILSTAMPAIASINGGSTYSNCNQTFSTPIVASATIYTWTVSAGATIVSGHGTNTVVVNYGALTGSQTIRVQATNACGVSSTVRSLTLSRGTCPSARKINSIIENSIVVDAENQIVVYPNPVNSLLSMETTNNTIIDKIIVVDLLGKVILEDRPTNNQINVERFASGTYIIHAFSGNEKFTNKFVKE